MLLSKRLMAPEVAGASILAGYFVGGKGGAAYDVNEPGVLWTDTAGTLPAFVGDDVARMDDVGGNGNNAIQSDPLYRPTLQQTVGGAYYLQPNGVNDHMDLPNGALDYENFTFIASVETNGNNQRVLDNRGTGATGSVRGWHFKARNDGADGFLIDDGSIAKVFNDDWSDTLFVAAGDWSGSGQPNLWINRAAETIDAGGLQTPTTLTTGNSGRLFCAVNTIGTQAFNGKFFGALVIDEVLSTTDRNDIEQHYADISGAVL